MTPEQEKLLMTLIKDFNDFKDTYYRTNFPDKMVLEKDLVLKNHDIDTEGMAGMKIGNSKSKLSVYGVPPVVQATAISAPTGGAVQDAEGRTAINLIRTALKNYGITL